MKRVRETEFVEVYGASYRSVAVHRISRHVVVWRQLTLTTNSSLQHSCSSHPSKHRPDREDPGRTGPTARVCLHRTDQCRFCGMRCPLCDVGLDRGSLEGKLPGSIRVGQVPYDESAGGHSSLRVQAITRSGRTSIAHRALELGLVSFSS